MNKIFLIIQREYLSRVKKKSFIVMTILGPVLMGALIAVAVYMAVNQGNTLSVVKVVDETGQLSGKLTNSKSVVFIIDTMPIVTARTIFSSNDAYGLLYIPANTLESSNTPVLFTEKQPTPVVVGYIENELQKQMEGIKLSRSGIQKSTLDSIKTNINLQQKQVDPKAKEQDFSSDMTSGIGFVAGLLIYMFIFMYGIQVMRGVLEEKTNRIVEVIISSVKPFQLMMGKIIGIALVGLTQFFLWIVLTVAIIKPITVAVTGQDNETRMRQLQESSMKMSDADKKTAEHNMPANPLEIFDSINLPKMIFCFIFYFLGGFLLYSALFAAIGAVVDSETDTQQFMLPITIPLIFAYVVSTVVMTNPESQIGYWFSIIPFTSPIVMMVRMPFDPPITDIAISMVLLIAGFIFTTWIAGRLYRTGILMYGKKPTYKELAKWLFYKS